MSTLACCCCCCCCWRSFLAYHWRELPQVGFLSRQTHIDFCHDNYNVCRDKHIFVATNTRLSRQKCYLWQLPPMVLSYFFKPCQLLFCCLISLFFFFFFSFLFFFFLLFNFFYFMLVLFWFAFDYLCLRQYFILAWADLFSPFFFFFFFCCCCCCFCFVLFCLFLFCPLFSFSYSFSCCSGLFVDFRTKD